MDNTTKAILKRFRLADKGSKPLCLSKRYDRYHIAQLMGEVGFTIGAEIGVRRGNYSKYLLDTIPNLKLYCVDPWAPHSAKYTQERQDGYYQITVEKLKQYNAEIMRMTSNDALSSFLDNSLDFVFIDGDHTFDFVAPDIIYWSRKVKPGGIVLVHDCYGWSGAGVLQAVYAYTYCHDLTWFCTKEKEPTAFWVKP